jgi:hypothetical protein
VYTGKVLGGYEMWVKGGVMFGLPIIAEDYPADLKTALDRRRRATLAGRCECGAVLGVRRAGTVMHHQDGCIASDDSLDEIAARHGKRSVRLPPDAFDELS